MTKVSLDFVTDYWRPAIISIGVGISVTLVFKASYGYFKRSPAINAEPSEMLKTLKDLQLSVIELKDTINILNEQLQKPTKRGRSASRSNAFGRMDDDDDLFFESFEEPHSDEDLKPSSAPKSADAKSSIESFFQTVDSLRKQDKVAESIKYLEDNIGQFSASDETEWRIARALVDKGKIEVSRKKELTTQAQKHAENALKLNPNNHHANIYYAIATGSLAEFAPIKEKIEIGFKFKEYVEKAIQLCPTDPISYHLLGHWAFQVSAMTWFERKAAATLFGEPPSATYQETLALFEKAEQYSSEGWKSNLLMIAKTHQKLGNSSKYRHFLQVARDTKSRSMEDDAADVEIRTLLA